MISLSDLNGQSDFLADPRRSCRVVALLSAFVCVAWAFPAFSKPLLSKQEAEEFCLKTWFPRLRLGHTPATGEIPKLVDKLLELYAEDVELVDPNAPEMVQADSFAGKAQVRKYYEAVLAAYPVWNFTILEIFPTEKGFVLRYEGRDAGPVKRFEGVDILELKKQKQGWRIAKLMGYYDRAPFMTPATPR